MKYYYKLTVAYDGTNYCGWQVQNNGETIQGAMMGPARALFGDSVTLTGASRTDSGVHAEGQVVLLTGKKEISDYGLPRALNNGLPDDIVVIDCKRVDAAFHPRYQELSKTYEYQVDNSPFPMPKARRYSMHYRHKLELAPMLVAAKQIEGKHDFIGFAAAGTTVEDTVRTIHSIEIEQKGHMFLFRITGDGFLYNMVRIIVGTLLDVGNGRRTPESMADIISSRNRDNAGKTALAKGLTLKSIQYANEGETYE